MNYELFLALGNLCFTIASIPNIIAATRNKDRLIGFSFKGAITTFIGMNSVMLALFLLNSPLNMLLSIPTYIYWGLISWFNRPGV